jgi:hypothetical protein
MSRKQTKSSLSEGIAVRLAFIVRRCILQIWSLTNMIDQTSQAPHAGGHYVETIQGCVDQGLVPDFWMKTLHHTNYCSSQAKAEKDNIYCRNLEEVITFMESFPEPWIAFKTLAAGAITPKEGFRYAFENGAEYICAGMYDFQIVDDCNIALNKIQDRKRPWCAEPERRCPAMNEPVQHAKAAQLLKADAWHFEYRKKRRGRRCEPTAVRSATDHVQCSHDTSD